MTVQFEEQMGEWVRLAAAQRAEAVEAACAQAIVLGIGVKVNSWFEPPSTFKFVAVPDPAVPAGEIHDFNEPIGEP